MNIGTILESLGKVGRRVFAAAEHAIAFTRQAYGHLPGDGQHAQAVELLRRAFPDLAKWAAHVIVAVVFGWLEKNAPERLQPASSFTLDTGTDGTRAAEVSGASPFSVTGNTHSGGEKPEPARGVLAQLLQPQAPTL